MGFESPSHWVILLIIAALLFGGYKKLPEMSRSVGRSLRIFKTEMKGMTDDDAARDAAEEAKVAPPSPPPPPAVAPVEAEAPAVPIAPVSPQVPPMAVPPLSTAATPDLTKSPSENP